MNAGPYRTPEVRALPPAPRWGATVWARLVTYPERRARRKARRARAVRTFKIWMCQQRQLRAYTYVCQCGYCLVRPDGERRNALGERHPLYRFAAPKTLARLTEKDRDLLYDPTWAVSLAFPERPLVMFRPRAWLDFPYWLAEWDEVDPWRLFTHAASGPFLVAREGEESSG